MVDLSGVAEDVVFAWAAAEQLAGALEAAAAELDGSAAARQVWAQAARHRWRGRFAEDFDRDVARCLADQAEFAAALRQAAVRLRELTALAHQEQQRREVARAWQHRQERESVLKELWDGITGGDAPPEGPHSPPSSLVPTAAARRR